MKNVEIVTKYRKILWLYTGYQYQLTEKGQTCSDISLNVIVDEKECKKASEERGGTYEGTVISSEYPSGCYYQSYVGGYFNKHESGTGNANAKSICKQGVYQLIHNQSLSKIYILCGKITKIIF